ncbi:MAG: hypothetical protein AB1384_12440 [Actinomycetota bacterium]
MAYATYEDVERYSGLSFTAEEQIDVDKLCEDASAWMTEYCGTTDLGSLVLDGNTLRMLCARVVGGFWTLRQRNAEYAGAVNLKIGDFSASFEKVLDKDSELQLKLDAMRLRAETGGGVEVVEFDLGYI